MTWNDQNRTTTRSPASRYCVFTDPLYLPAFGRVHTGHRSSYSHFTFFYRQNRSTDDRPPTRVVAGALYASLGSARTGKLLIPVELRWINVANAGVVFQTDMLKPLVVYFLSEDIWG